MVVEHFNQQDCNTDNKIDDFDTSQTNATARTMKLELVAILVFRDERSQLNQQIEKSLLKLYGADYENPVLGLFSGKDWIDLISFKKKLGEFFTCFTLEIPQKGFSKFREILHANATTKTVYSCGGSQFGNFVYKNALISLTSGEVIFAQKMDESKSYDDIQNSLIDLSNNCRPELAKTKEEPKIIAQKFFINLRECFSNSEIFLCFGAVLATCFWDLFQEKLKGFPTIFFLGESHSGKSTLLFCLSSIFGLDDSSVMAGTSTPFAISKELGGRICIPLFIEELSDDFFKKTAELQVKSVYSAISRERGSKTGIEKLPIFTTFVATSNYSFKKPSEALLSRSLFVQMKKESFDRHKFGYFDEISRKELSVILPLILKYREWVIPLYMAVFKQLSVMIQNYSGDRYLRSVAISCSIWILVNKILGRELFDWKKMAIDYCESYEHYLQSRVTDSDLMLRHISKLISEEELTYGVHYQLVHDVILRLNLSKFVEIYNIKFATSSENMLTSQNFCFVVGGDRRFDTKRTKMKTIGRAISINIANEENLLAVVRGFKMKQSFGGRYEEDESEE